MKDIGNSLSNTQLELLKLFSTELDDNEMKELKKYLADFFAKRSIEHANQVWEEKDLTNDIMDEWLNEN